MPAVKLEILMENLTKGGFKSIQGDLDETTRQAEKVIAILKRIQTVQTQEFNRKQSSGLDVSKDLADIQALQGLIRGAEESLNELQKAKENVSKTPIDVDIEDVTRKTNNLKLQFQQVARELPSLTMGPQMFFLAISNNLPMLADAIADVRKQNELLIASGQKAVPVWKQLATSIFSWQTALVAVISLLIVYSKDVSSFFSELFKGKEKINSAEEALKKFNESMTKGMQEGKSQAVTLDLLYEAATNEAKATDERRKAVDELQKQYPAYFKNLSDEEIMLGKAKSAYESLSESILASAKARAAVETIQSNEKELITLNAQLDVAKKNLESAKQLQDLQKAGNIRNTSGAAFAPAAAGSKELSDAGAAVRKYEDEVDQLQSKIESLTLSNQKLADSVNVKDLFADYGQGSSSVTTQKTDYASQLAEARLEAQRKLEKARLEVMKEGREKRRAEALQEYNETLDDISSQQTSIRNKLDEAKKAGYKVTDDDYQNVDTTADEARKAAKMKYAQQLYNIEKSYWDQQTNDMLEYLAEYGTYEDKRLAIARQYAIKIAEADTKGQRLMLEKERDNAISGINFDELKDSMDWEVIFGNLSKVSKEELQKIKQQLKQFKQSPEYKNMTVDQQKIVNEAINSIQENIIDKGGILGDLPEQLQDLAAAQNELKTAQEEYNEALISGTETEIQAARQKKSQASQNVINAQSNVNQSAEKAQNNISTVIDSISNLGQAGASLTSFGNSIGTLIDVFSESESKIGGIVGAILGLLDQLGQKGIMGVADGILSNVWNLAGHMWDSIGSLFGIKGLGGIFYGADYSGYDSMKSQYESLIDIWDTLIDKKTQYIDIDYGIEAQKAADEATMLVETQIQRQRQLAQALSESGKSIGSHSLGVRVNKRMSTSDWERLSDLVGSPVRNMEDVINLDTDVIGKVLQDEKFVSVLTEVNSEFIDYIQNIDQYAQQLEEIAQKEKEALVGTSFDEFRDSFVSMLSDLDATNQDFADNFEKYLQNAIFSSLIANQYKDKITQLYDQWAGLTESDGALTSDEADILRNKYQDLINEMLADRDRIMNDFGWTSSGSSGSNQSPGSGALTTMSQDSINVWEGILRNIQTHLVHIDNNLDALRNSMNVANDNLNRIAINTSYLGPIHELLEKMDRDGVKLAN